MYSPTLLQDKIILITGGGSGIGYAIAEAALRTGAKVIIASRKAERLQQAADQLSALGHCSWQVCDTRQPDQIEALANYLAQHYGRLDVLINNAGGQFPSLAEDISLKGWQAVINNNLNGTWYMSQILAQRFFIPQKQGRILNIIANIYRGFAGMAHTGAARAGVDNLTKSLAVEWSKYNLRINAIAPGIIASTGLEQYPPALVEGMAAHIPLQRLGRPEEVAALAIYMLSPLADYLTGETIYLDGGQKLWGDAFPLAT